MKKGIICLFLIIIILFVFVNARDEFGGEVKSDEFGDETTTEEEIIQWSDASSIPEESSLSYSEATEEQPATLDISNQGESWDQFTEIEDTVVETVDGSIANFNMVNALFSLGSLVQGSFISFENNNNIYWKSLFDSSKFTATLNEEGELSVGQKNSHDLGKVYITINNGNLTQDEYVVFIPDGNEPTYIYYNTTEIEFKDGNVSLLGETVSNNDDSQEKTKVQFNENGFTKVQLPKENIYSINDYSIQNLENSPIIICKKDPLCDINIDENKFTINGKVKFLEKNELLLESKDENNEIIIDLSNKSISFFNSNPTEELLLITYLQNHKITETQTNLFEYPTNNGMKYFTYESKLHNKLLDLKENLVYNSFTAYETEFMNYIPIITGAFLGGYENDLGLSVFLVMILIGLLVFVQYKRKAQMTIFAMFGIAILLIIGIIMYLSINSTNPENTLTEIESLEQAQEAVEDCEKDTIEEGISLLGMHSGYIDESFSAFGTAYDIIPIEAMESNLEEYLDDELRNCGDVLDGTKFSFESMRFETDVTLADEISVEVSSIGRIQNTNSINVNEIKEDYSINYIEIVSIMQELIDSEYGIPVNSYEGYEVESYTNEDLTERLIVVRDSNNFEFRLSQKL